MAGPLLIIYQRSWESGEALADWKPDSVIPVYKNGMKEGPGIYRPVILTSVLEKSIKKFLLGTA